MTKVLIVDDSLFIRGHLAKLLIAEGYEIMTAENGVKAIAVYQERRPDVVLMDITMPQQDGLWALEALLTLDPEARVIMLTALDQPAAANQAMQLGAKDFLPKPVDVKKLSKTLKRLLR